MNDIEWRAGRYRRDLEAVRARHLARAPRVGLTQGRTHPNDVCTMARAEPTPGSATAVRAPLSAFRRSPPSRADWRVGGRVSRLQPRAPLVD